MLSFGSLDMRRLPADGSRSMPTCGLDIAAVRAVVDGWMWSTSYRNTAVCSHGKVGSGTRTEHARADQRRELAEGMRKVVVEDLISKSRTGPATAGRRAVSLQSVRTLADGLDPLAATLSTRTSTSRSSLVPVSSLASTTSTMCPARILHYCRLCADVCNGRMVMGRWQEGRGDCDGQTCLEVLCAWIRRRLSASGTLSLCSLLTPSGVRRRPTQDPSQSSPHSWWCLP